MGRLRWRGRRGMKELDDLLERYFDHHPASCDEALIAGLEQLLDCEDTQLLDWLLGRSLPQDLKLKEIVEKIRRALKQPD